MAVSATLRGLLGERNFAIFLLGNSVSLTGSWIQRIAVAWLVWDLTHSTFWIGIYAASGVVPILLTGLAGGVLADRMSRRTLTLWSQGFACLLVGALFVAFRLDFLSLYLLIGFRVLHSGATGIAQPARLALVPALVSKERLVGAVSVNSVTFNVARLVGPALAASIIAWGGMGAAFLVNALSYLPLIAALAVIRVDPRTAPGGRRQGMFREMGQAVGYVGRYEGMRVIFVLFGVVVLFARPISAMLPAIADVAFGRGVEGFALLTSAMAAGSILGGLWAAGRVARGLTSSTILAAVAYALCIGLLVSVGIFSLAVLAIALTGFFTVAFGSSAQALVHICVDEALRGRVMSLWFIVMRAGPELGALVMGLAAEHAGLSLAFTGGSALCLLACLWAWNRRHRIDDLLERPAAPATVAAGAVH